MKVELACSLRARFRGLIGWEGFDAVLLLAPCNDVHTFGMRGEIDVAFIDANGMVIESWRGLGARKRRRCKRAVATLERFSKDEPWFEVGDQLEIMPCAAAHGESDDEEMDL